MRIGFVFGLCCTLLLLHSCGKEEEIPLPPVANGIVLFDLGNNGDGRDLRVSFSKAAIETGIAEYRVIIVDAARGPQFTAELAAALPSDRYTSAAPGNGTTHVFLGAESKSEDGNAIAENIPYIGFVLSVSRDDTYALSRPSAPLTLTLPPTPPVTDVTLSDISNFGDGRDLKVEFKKASDESQLSEYRVVIVKSPVPTGFNLIVAQSLPASRYTTLAKTGSDQSLVMSSVTTDTDGDLIVDGKSYIAFVLSVGLGRSIGQNAISTPSSVVKVTIPTAPVASNLVVSDVANAGNSSDLEVTFVKATNESLISNYRLIILPDGASLGLAEAESLPAARYHQVSKAAQSRLQLPVSLVDATGTGIIEGKSYRLVILSIADGQLAGVNSLSTPSALTMLARKSAVRTLTRITSAGTGGMQVDAAGNIYMGDFGTTDNGGGGEVYKITPNGMATVFASGFVTADGNDIDSQGNFYQVSWNQNQIVKITPAGTRTVFAEGSPLQGPIGIAIDANDDLYVTNYDGNKVVRITKAGTMSTLSTSSLLNGPNGIDVDPSGNFLYVSNWNNGNVLKMDKVTGTASVFASTGASNNSHLVVHKNAIYIAARSNHQIMKITLTGSVTTFVGTGAKGDTNGDIATATICWPNDIAFNADGTKMYISTVDASAATQNILGPAVIREVSLVE